MGIITAQQLEENEQYDKAYEEYKKITNPTPEILERLGHLALILEKNDEAIEYYNKILELEPANVLAHEQLMDLYIDIDKFKYYISRGNLHILQQEFFHAIGDFKKALDKANNDEEINSSRFVLATLYEKTGKDSNAIDEYLRILESPAKNEQTYINLANVYLREDSPASAIETLERAINDGYDTPIIKELLAELYLKNNQQEKARNYTSDELTHARSYLDEEENEKAFKILEKVKDENKKNPKYYALLAQYYYNTKNWEQALSAVDEFQKLDKASPLIYQMRAIVYEEQGKDYEAHINWAKYNLRRENNDVALNEYYMALKIKEDDPELILDVAELLEEMKDKTQAGEFWYKLTKLEPDNKRALEKLAEFQESIGSYREQAETLEQLCKVSNKNLLFVKKLAETYDRLKNRDKALECYKYFVEHSPVNEDYEKAKVRIEKLSITTYSQSAEEEGLIDKIMRLFSKK